MYMNKNKTSDCTVERGQQNFYEKKVMYINKSCGPTPTGLSGNYFAVDWMVKSIVGVVPPGMEGQEICIIYLVVSKSGGARLS